MLDPKILRENPDKIRKMLNDRKVDVALDEFIKLEKSSRDLINKTDELRKKRNEISIEIAKRKKANQDTTSLIEQMQETSQILTDLEIEQTQTESNYTKLALTIPNLVDESVPIGKDDTVNREIKKWDEIPQFDFKVKDHINISQSLTSRARGVAER